MGEYWMVWIGCMAVLGAAAEEPYVWPLELPRQLTSSFAEYRSGRFHAGIDLRTGEIGKPVYAADDGYVARIRSSPFGYGKAVYLRLTDGKTVVYGHLDAFEEPFADYVRQAQHARESYEVDLYPERDQFPVARGQLIAHSGNTGIGYPHLHYELRDEADRLVNPRLLGITWPDTGRPTPRKVVVVPEGPGSWVNGDLLPVVLDVRATTPGVYATDSIRVRGTIGVGIDVIDPAHGSKLGVWRIVTALDETEVFRIQHDVFSYDNTHNAAVAYHPFLAGNGRFLTQWRWPGNDSPIYRHSTKSGWMAVPDGEHAVTLRVADFYENEAVVTIPIIGEPPTENAAAGQNADPGAVTYDCWDTWIAVTAAFPAEDPAMPVLLVNGAPQEPGFRAVGAGICRAAYRPERRTERAVLEVRHPRIEPIRRTFLVGLRGEKARVMKRDGLEIRSEPTSPYGALFISVDEADLVGKIGAAPIGKAYTIGFAESPIDEPVTLSFQVPLEETPPERVHIYRVNGSSLSREGGTRDGEMITIRTRRLGTFVPLEDNAPPSIQNFRTIARDAPKQRPKIEATIDDALSGIDTIRLTCNDRWLLIRYDPEHHHIRWEQDQDLPSGVAEVTLTVTDHSRNVTEKTLAVTIP